MKRSHAPSSRAKTSTRAPLDAQPDTQDAAAETAAPSDPIPAARIPGEPPGSSSSGRSLYPLRWADPAHAEAWLTATRAAFADLAAAAREGSRRLKHRVLSRAELQRQVRAAEIRLVGLFDAAEAGLAASRAKKGASGE